MTRPTSHLIFREKKMGLATREAYGQSLREIGQEDPRIVALDADLSKSTKSGLFAGAFPDRFFNCGIAEANMISIAAGLASCGKIPFVSTFASFLFCKGFDQIRMSVMLPGLNVKFVGSHAGISLGEDGASQQAVEDLGLALSLPGLMILVPADEIACRAAVQSAAAHTGPVYIRTGRPKAPLLYDTSERFEMGVAKTITHGSDVTVLAIGLLVWEAIVARDICQERGISATVIDLYSLRPLDTAAVIAAARETRAVVTVEEHLLSSGMGSQVAHLLSQHLPTPLVSVGIDNTYAESGTPEQLFEKYGLTAWAIVQAVETVLKRKG